MKIQLIKLNEKDDAIAHLKAELEAMKANFKEKRKSTQCDDCESMGEDNILDEIQPIDEIESKDDEENNIPIDVEDESNVGPTEDSYNETSIDVDKEETNDINKKLLDANNLFHNLTYYSSSEDCSSDDDKSVTSPPRLKSMMNSSTLIPSPFQKQIDNKDDYSIQTEPATLDQVSAFNPTPSKDFKEAEAYTDLSVLDT